MNADAARDGSGARHRAEHAPESEAVEALVRAALDVLHHDRSEDSSATEYNQRVLADRFSAILSSRVETAREEMKEECAKLIHEDALERKARAAAATSLAAHNGLALEYATLVAASHRIRSLSTRIK